MEKFERLDKIISTQTSYSRKDIKKLCRSGDIYVNGQVCRNSDAKVDPQNTEIIVCGEKIEYKKTQYVNNFDVLKKYISIYWMIMII